MALRSTYLTVGQVAVVKIQNPPVNSITHEVRKSLKINLQRALDTPRISAVVLCGDGACFSAGMHIPEFASGDTSKEPLDDLISKMGSSPKPIVAAIHGFAMGGGLELALACHYRVGEKAARIGLPEVLVGVLPQTATQKLPRLIGLKVSLDIIRGRSMNMVEAQQLGLVDKTFTGNFFNQAVKFANSIAGKPFNDRIISQMPIRDTELLDELCDKSLAMAKRRFRGALAPILCVKAIRAAYEYPYKEALQKVSAYTVELLASGQAQALQYVFNAERNAAKWHTSEGASHKAAFPYPVASAGVVGGGTMGTGIIVSLLNANLPVTLVESDEHSLSAAVNRISAIYAESVRLGKQTTMEMQACMDRLTPSVHVERLSSADVIIEAIYEQMALKKQLFKKLDEVCKPSAMLFTNTSMLDINEIASVTGRPRQVLGTHFLTPAHINEKMEVVYGQKTSPNTIATAMSLCKKIGKRAVVVGNCTGFVGNRMMFLYSREKDELVKEGASPYTIDKVMEDFGMGIGPFKMEDMNGLDIHYTIFHGTRPSLGDKKNIKDYDLTDFLTDILCHEGRLGRKTQAGWYKYKGRVAYEDDWTLSMLENYRSAHNITPRTITKEEIIERCIYPMINEGFHIIDEGIVATASNVDVVWLGYGWPRHLGGPMYYAQSVGLKKVLERLTFYQNKYPNTRYWKPSRLLKKAEHEGIPLEKWASRFVLSHL